MKKNSELFVLRPSLRGALDKSNYIWYTILERRDRAMSEIRFSYEPFKKEFFDCPTSHSTALYNKGKQRFFDQYIRGIIIDNKLYLRTYYPFDDISNLKLYQLHQRSRTLLEQFKEVILVALKKEYGFSPSVIKYNVENDLLTGIGLANI